MVKEQDATERLEEASKEDYEKKNREMLHKMMGCNQDHAAEIDIYKKPYKEKMKRI